jgi:cell filamentation protein
VNEDDPYLYRGSAVLQNKLGIRDEVRLEQLERQLVAQRIAEGCPAGDFDLGHLCRIHLHLFQDIYAWAGELRAVEISKDGSQFQFRRFLQTGMADIHQRLKAADYLRGLSLHDFAEAAGRAIGDVNYVHPFRDGNGRAQLQYLEQLASRAGHPMALARLNPQRWLDASKASMAGDYGPLSREIERASGAPG